MALILNIETATPLCSVSLAKDGILRSIQTSVAQNIHSEKLTLFIEAVMQNVGIDFKALDAIAVSEGPGSYTGLRIGASVAKGVCYGLNKPLIAIETLQAMAKGMSLQHSDEKAWYCPMIDARRMEVYTAIYDFYGKKIEAVSAKIIDEMTFQKLLLQQKVVFGGDGAKKCETVIKSPNALFLNTFQHSSEWMIPLSEEKFNKKQFADTAYFEPFYFKEFQAGKKKANT